MVASVVGPTSTVFLVQYPQVTSGEEILPSDRASKSKTSKGVFKYYVSIVIASLDPHSPIFAGVILEQKVSCLMTYTACFILSKYAFLLF